MFACLKDNLGAAVSTVGCKLHAVGLVPKERSEGPTLILSNSSILHGSEWTELLQASSLSHLTSRDRRVPWLSLCMLCAWVIAERGRAAPAGPERRRPRRLAANGGRMARPFMPCTSCIAYDGPRQAPTRWGRRPREQGVVSWFVAVNGARARRAGVVKWLNDDITMLSVGGVSRRDPAWPGQTAAALC